MIEKYIGQEMKIHLDDGLSAFGILSEIVEECLVLIQKNHKHKLYIYNYPKRLAMFQILSHEDKKESLVPENYQEESVALINEIMNSSDPKNSDLSAKRLSDLYKLKQEQEKQSLRDQLIVESKKSQDTEKPRYELSNQLLTNYNPPQEARNNDATKLRKLRGLQNK